MAKPAPKRLEPVDYFKNLEYPCPPLEFYAYGIDQSSFGGFFVMRVKGDGGIVWHYDANYYEGDSPDFPNQSDELSDALNGWPGYGGGSATLDGYFAHCIDGSIGSENRFGFYHVGPNMEFLGHSMMMPLGVSPAGDRGGWGQEVVRDDDGDHYANYYSFPYNSPERPPWDPPMVVGWRGTGKSPEDEKWRVTRSQIPDPHDKRPYAGSLALAPDGTTLVATYSEGFYQGINKDTGEVLWTYTLRDEANATDAVWMMENTVRAVFAPQGHLLINLEMGSYIIYPNPPWGDYWSLDKSYGAIRRLDFPDGYHNMPVMTWEANVGEDLTPIWIVALPDGGAVMNSLHHNGPAMLVRVDASGNIVWNNDIADETPGAVFYEPYSPMVLIGDRVHASIRGPGGQSSSLMIPYSVKNGLLDVREGEAWPQSKWQIGSPPVPRPDSADCRPGLTDYFKPIPPEYAPYSLFAVSVGEPTSNDRQLRFVDSDGKFVAELDTGLVMGEMVMRGREVTGSGSGINDSRVGIGRWTPEGLVWWWQRPAELSSAINNLTLSEDGAVYFIMGISLGFAQYRVNPSGTQYEHIGNYSPDFIPGLDQSDAMASMASRDGSMVYHLVGKWNIPGLYLYGVRVSDGALVFQDEVPMPTGWSHTIHGDSGSLARVPDTDSLVAVADVHDGTDSTIAVLKLDFLNGIDSAPTVAWSDVLYNTGGWSGSTLNVLANSDSVLIGHPPLGTGTTKPDRAIASCLEMADGSLRWRFEDQASASWPYSIALSGRKLLVRIYDQVRFPKPYPGGGGYIMVDIDSGKEVAIGVIPYGPAYAESLAGADQPDKLIEPPATDFFTDEEV